MALTRLPSFTLDSTSSFTFANATITSNIITGNLLTDNILYSNGTPYAFTSNASGSNTQVQFNDSGSFGGDANLTFDKTTGELSVTSISANGIGLTNLLGTQVVGEVAFANKANSVAGANVTGAVSYASTANSVAVANVVGIGNIATINKDGNASNILYGNGVFAAVPSSTYGDSDVAAYLPTYTGNITAGNITTTGNVVVGGNLTVQGTTVTVNATTVAVSDLAIELAKDATTAAEANAAGIIIKGANANILYNSTSNSFVFSHILTGNGFGLTSLLGTQVTGEVAFANKANYVAGANVNGAVSFATTANSVAVGNVTGIGNIATINKDGNASNILYGNGVFAAPAASSNYGDSNVAAYLPTYTGDISANTISAANITISNTFTVSNITTSGSGGNITGANVISANYFVGNGAQLTGLPSGYANADVANYLPTYTGNFTAGNIVASGNITGSYIIGNGSQLTGLPAGYTNSDVANYLPTYTGNLSPGNLKTDNLLYANGSPYAFTSNASGSNTQIQFNDGNAFAGNAALTFNKVNSTLTANSIILTTSANLGTVANVHIAGGTSGQVLSTDGTGNLTWSTPAGLAITVDSFTGNGVQTEFTLTTTPADENFTIVSLAGTLQPRSVYTVSGNVLTFSSAPPDTAPVEITTFTGGAAVAGGGSGAVNSVNGLTGTVELYATQLLVANTGTTAFSINGSDNANIEMIRGRTYKFNVNASGHNLWITTFFGAYNASNVYSTGVSNNGEDVGNIYFTVPDSAPDTLYYVCENHSDMKGNILIKDMNSSGTITANVIYANSIVNNGSGTPTINSATSINLTATEVVRTTSSPFQFYNCSSTVRDTIAASNGYVIYNTTTNKLQVYANGAWVDLH